MTAILPVIPEAIPAALKDRPRWLCWVKGAVRRNGKRPKVPVNPRTGRAGIDATDPRQLGTFDQAFGRYRRGGVDGVGFSLAPPFAAGDLDGCVDPGTGDLDAWAADILGEFRTYAERSPSGEGLRLIGLGRLDPDKRNKRGPVELYAERRYVTLTGHKLPDAPRTVADCIEAFARLQDRITPGPARPAAATVPGDGFQGADADLLERAQRAANGERVRRSWAGPTGGRTPSEDLLGLARLLAFWTGPDPGRLDRLVTASPLFAACEAERRKWDSPRRGGTWGQVIVRKAIDLTPVFYPGKGGDHNRYRWGATGGLSAAWARVSAGEMAPGFLDDTRGRLASLGWHLAGCRPGGRFFLAERDAAALLGITKTPTRTHLQKLEATGVIRAARRGIPRPAGGAATEFVWLGVSGEGLR